MDGLAQASGGGAQPWGWGRAVSDFTDLPPKCLQTADSHGKRMKRD